MAKSFVPPSRVGNLHSNLGIPQGEKIGMKRLQSAKSSPRPLVRKEANEAINMQGGKNSSPKPKAASNPVGRVVSRAGKMAHKEVMSHFSDPTIVKAISAHAKGQANAL
jgi:hypothetical protein